MSYVKTYESYLIEQAVALDSIELKHALANVYSGDIKKLQDDWKKAKSAVLDQVLSWIGVDTYRTSDKEISDLENKINKVIKTVKATDYENI